MGDSTIQDGQFAIRLEHESIDDTMDPFEMKDSDAAMRDLSNDLFDVKTVEDRATKQSIQLARLVTGRVDGNRLEQHRETLGIDSNPDLEGSPTKMWIVIQASYKGAAEHFGGGDRIVRYNPTTNKYVVWENGRPTKDTITDITGGASSYLVREDEIEVYIWENGGWTSRAVLNVDSVGRSAFEELHRYLSTRINVGNVKDDIRVVDALTTADFHRPILTNYVEIQEKAYRDYDIENRGVTLGAGWFREVEESNSTTALHPLILTFKETRSSTPEVIYLHEVNVLHLEKNLSNYSFVDAITGEEVQLRDAFSIQDGVLQPNKGYFQANPLADALYGYVKNSDSEDRQNQVGGDVAYLCGLIRFGFLMDAAEVDLETQVVLFADAEDARSAINSIYGMGTRNHLHQQNQTTGQLQRAQYVGDANEIGVERVGGDTFRLPQNGLHYGFYDGEGPGTNVILSIASYDDMRGAIEHPVETSYDDLSLSLISDVHGRRYSTIYLPILTPIGGNEAMIFKDEEELHTYFSKDGIKEVADYYRVPDGYRLPTPDELKTFLTTNTHIVKTPYGNTKNGDVIDMHYLQQFGTTIRVVSDEHMIRSTRTRVGSPMPVVAIESFYQPISPAQDYGEFGQDLNGNQKIDKGWDDLDGWYSYDEAYVLGELCNYAEDKFGYEMSIRRLVSDDTRADVFEFRGEVKVAQYAMQYNKQDFLDAAIKLEEAIAIMNDDEGIWVEGIPEGESVSKESAEKLVQAYRNAASGNFHDVIEYVQESWHTGGRETTVSLGTNVIVLLLFGLVGTISAVAYNKFKFVKRNVDAMAAGTAAAGQGGAGDALKNRVENEAVDYLVDEAVKAGLEKPSIVGRTVEAESMFSYYHDLYLDKEWPYKMGVLTADSGAGKTMLFEGMAQAVATGFYPNGQPLDAKYANLFGEVMVIDIKKLKKISGANHNGLVQALYTALEYAENYPKNNDGKLCLVVLDEGVESLIKSGDLYTDKDGVNKSSPLIQELKTLKNIYMLVVATTENAKQITQFTRFNPGDGGQVDRRFVPIPVPLTQYVDYETENGVRERTKVANAYVGMEELQPYYVEELLKQRLFEKPLNKIKAESGIIDVSAVDAEFFKNVIIHSSRRYVEADPSRSITQLKKYIGYLENRYNETSVRQLVSSQSFLEFVEHNSSGGESKVPRDRVFITMADFELPFARRVRQQKKRRRAMAEDKPEKTSRLKTILDTGRNLWRRRRNRWETMADAAEVAPEAVNNPEVPANPDEMTEIEKERVARELAAEALRRATPQNPSPREPVTPRPRPVVPNPRPARPPAPSSRTIDYSALIHSLGIKDVLSPVLGEVATDASLKTLEANLRTMDVKLPEVKGIVTGNLSAAAVSGDFNAIMAMLRAASIAANGDALALEAFFRDRGGFVDFTGMRAGEIDLALSIAFEELAKGETNKDAIYRKIRAASQSQYGREPIGHVYGRVGALIEAYTNPEAAAYLAEKYALKHTRALALDVSDFWEMGTTPEERSLNFEREFNSRWNAFSAQHGLSGLSHQDARLSQNAQLFGMQLDTGRSLDFVSQSGENKSMPVELAQNKLDVMRATYQRLYERGMYPEWVKAQLAKTELEAKLYYEKTGTRLNLKPVPITMGEKVRAQFQGATGAAHLAMAMWIAGSTIIANSQVPNYSFMQSMNSIATIGFQSVTGLGTFLAVENALKSLVNGTAIASEKFIAYLSPGKARSVTLFIEKSVAGKVLQTAATRVGPMVAAGIALEVMTFYLNKDLQGQLTNLVETGSPSLQELERHVTRKHLDKIFKVSTPGLVAMVGTSMLVGAVLGSTEGAVVGTFVVPGPGTAIGAAGGAILGLAAGALVHVLGDRIYEAFDSFDTEAKLKAGFLEYTAQLQEDVNEDERIEFKLIERGEDSWVQDMRKSSHEHEWSQYLNTLKLFKTTLGDMRMYRDMIEAQENEMMRQRLQSIQDLDFLAAMRRLGVKEVKMGLADISVETLMGLLIIAAKMPEGDKNIRLADLESLMPTSIGAMAFFDVDVHVLNGTRPGLYRDYLAVTIVEMAALRLAEATSSSDEDDGFVDVGLNNILQFIQKQDEQGKPITLDKAGVERLLFAPGYTSAPYTIARELAAALGLGAWASADYAREEGTRSWGMVSDKREEFIQDVLSGLQEYRKQHVSFWDLKDAYIIEHYQEAFYKPFIAQADPAELALLNIPENANDIEALFANEALLDLVVFYFDIYVQDNPPVELRNEMSQVLIPNLLETYYREVNAEVDNVDIDVTTSLDALNVSWSQGAAGDYQPNLAALFTTVFKRDNSNVYERSLACRAMHELLKRNPELVRRLIQNYEIDAEFIASIDEDAFGLPVMVSGRLENFACDPMFEKLAFAIANENHSLGDVVALYEEAMASGELTLAKQATDLMRDLGYASYAQYLAGKTIQRTSEAVAVLGSDVTLSHVSTVSLDEQVSVSHQEWTDRLVMWAIYATWCLHADFDQVKEHWHTILKQYGLDYSRDDAFVVSVFQAATKKLQGITYEDVLAILQAEHMQDVPTVYNQVVQFKQEWVWNNWAEYMTGEVTVEHGGQLQKITHAQDWNSNRIDLYNKGSRILRNLRSVESLTALSPVERTDLQDYLTRTNLIDGTYDHTQSGRNHVEKVLARLFELEPQLEVCVKQNLYGESQFHIGTVNQSVSIQTYGMMVRMSMVHALNYLDEGGMFEQEVGGF
jgi:hypothetical protein